MFSLELKYYSWWWLILLWFTNNTETLRNNSEFQNTTGFTKHTQRNVALLLEVVCFFNNISYNIKGHIQQYASNQIT